MELVFNIATTTGKGKRTARGTMRPGKLC